jgi:formyl-CoA transferase
MRLSRTPGRRDAAGPVLGADTRTALLAVGYSPGEVDDLVATGVAAGPTG